jgi:glycosyltransferase 2 family protein
VKLRSPLAVLLKAVLSVGLVALLLARSDVGRLWDLARGANVAWIAAAIAAYAAMIGVSAWRWGRLLHAQGVHATTSRLAESFLVATFFNNFLPSNIGGDVVRVTDTAGAAGSKTLAATVVLVDRGLGVVALGLIAAAGATLARTVGPIGAPIVWSGLALFLGLGLAVVLKPSAVAAMCAPVRRVKTEWVDIRLERLTGALERFRDRPEALALGFAGALVVQALLVLFYAGVARSLSISIGLSDLAVVVPASLLVQMIPVSLNGLGVREATFGFYFRRLGLPLESALLVSLGGAGLVMAFSLVGAGLYAGRQRTRKNRQVLDSQASASYSKNSG